MTLMLAILIITIPLFIWGKFTPDIIALVSILSLFVVGMLDLTGTPMVMTAGDYKFMNYLTVGAPLLLFFLLTSLLLVPLIRPFKNEFEIKNYKSWKHYQTIQL